MSQVAPLPQLSRLRLALLGMVLALCTISVFEIYSATLRTKFATFHNKQIVFIVVGMILMSSSPN